MDRKAVVLIILLLTTMVIASGAYVKHARATEFLNDGFESGDDSAFSGNTTTDGGTFEVVSVDPHHDTYHARFNSSGGETITRAAVYYTFGSPQSVVNTRFQYKFVSGLIPDSGDEQKVLDYYDLSGTQMIIFSAYNESGTAKWQLKYFDEDATIYNRTTSPSISTGKYYCIEVYTKIHATEGAVEAYVDGTKIICEYNLNTTAYGNIDRVHVGMWGTSIQDAAVSYMDCVVIADYYIGTEGFFYRKVGETVHAAGYNTTLHVECVAELNLSYYIVGHNNTGTFTNETAVAFPVDTEVAWANLTDLTLNSTVGYIIQWCTWFNNTANSWLNTGLQAFTLTKVMTFTGISHSTEYAGQNSTFQVTVSCANGNLSHYIFGTNNTGLWENTTYAFTSGVTQETVYVYEVLNDTGDYAVTYNWWTNNTDNIWDSTGNQTFVITSLTDRNRAEWRGMFFGGNNVGVEHNWTKMIETCLYYNITNGIFSGIRFGHGYYEGQPGQWPNEVKYFLGNCSALGMKPYIIIGMNIINPNEFPEYEVEDENGTSTFWLCPQKASSGSAYSYWINQLDDFMDKYGGQFAGIFFDYIRYVLIQHCYCDECRAAFEAYLGEGIGDWTPFYPNGARHTEYLNWRTIPVTNYLKNTKAYLLSRDSTLEFHVASFTCGSSCPTYFHKFLGQRTSEWTKDGLVDSVSPMLYYANPTYSQDDYDDLVLHLQGNGEWLLGGQEGKLPLIPFITTGVSQAANKTFFVDEIEAIRQYADGWIIWQYDGPGCEDSFPWNTTEYLDLIDLPVTTQIENVTSTSITATSVKVEWDTHYSSDSLVEYTPLPNRLFVSHYLVNISCTPGVIFYDTDHTEGLSQTNSTLATHHALTLTNLLRNTHYEYRVQSSKGEGIITSLTHNFSTMLGGSSFTFNHTDLDGNTVDTEITWTLWNFTQQISYTEGSYTLSDGTYTLKSYRHGYLINTTSLPTETVGNTTVEINLGMKVISEGYVTANKTVTITIVTDTSLNVTYTADTTGGLRFIIDVYKNTTVAPTKDDTPIADWTYISNTAKYIVFNETLSGSHTFKLSFATLTPLFYFGFRFKGIGNIDVNASITWDLSNETGSLGYTNNSVTLSAGSYNITTSYLGHEINRTLLTTGDYGNTTVTLNLAMTPHSSVTGGYLAFNHTSVSITAIYAQTERNLVFQFTAVGSVLVVARVPQNCSFIMKDATNITDWTYSTSPSKHVYLTMSQGILALTIEKAAIKVNGVPVILKINGVS